MTSKSLFKSLCLATSALCTQTYTPVIAKPLPTTPIQHVIIIVGENHTFDNLFGTYKPTAGQTIDNLLSKGIVNADGTPGPHFDKAKQTIGSDDDPALQCEDAVDRAPMRRCRSPTRPTAIGLPQGVLDTRFPANLPERPVSRSANTCLTRRLYRRPGPSLLSDVAGL